MLDICASVNTLIPFQHLPFLPSLVPFFERSRHSDIWSRSRWDIVAGIRTATNLLSFSAPQSHSQRKRDFLWRWLIWVIQWVEKFKLCNQIFRSNQLRVVLTTSNTYVPRKCYLRGNPKSTSQFLQFRTMPKTHLSRNSSSLGNIWPSVVHSSVLPSVHRVTIGAWCDISIPNLFFSPPLSLSPFHFVCSVMARPLPLHSRIQMRIEFASMLGYHGTKQRANLGPPIHGLRSVPSVPPRACALSQSIAK